MNRLCSGHFEDAHYETSYVTIGALLHVLFIMTAANSFIRNAQSFECRNCRKSSLLVTNKYLNHVGILFGFVA